MTLPAGASGLGDVTAAPSVSPAVVKAVCAPVVVWPRTFGTITGGLTMMENCCWSD
jgi:hypothetical protein